MWLHFNNKLFYIPIKSYLFDTMIFFKEKFILWGTTLRNQGVDFIKVLFQCHITNRHFGVTNKTSGLGEFYYAEITLYFYLCNININKIAYIYNADITITIIDISAYFFLKKKKSKVISLHLECYLMTVKYIIWFSPLKVHSPKASLVCRKELCSRLACIIRGVIITLFPAYFGMWNH